MEDLRKKIEEKIDRNKDKVVAHNIFKPLTFNQIDLLSRMIKKNVDEMLSLKNPNDYNFDLISSVIDKPAMLFMEAGQKYIKNGDVLNFHTFNEIVVNVSQAFIGMENDKALNAYNQYPFNLHIASELRTKSILKTSSREDFSDLYVVLKTALKNYLKDSEIDLINKAVNKAKNRIFQNKIKFLNPIPSTEQGKEESIPLTDYPKYDLEYLVDNDMPNEEAAKVLDSEFKFDLRSDNFDILALKELVLVLNKEEKFDYFSIAPGFFNKIMPELNELGIDAVVFKVQNEELSEIKLVSFAGRNHIENKIHYSPLAASIALLSSYACETSVTQLKLLDGSIVDHSKISKFDSNQLNDASFYITVNGAVSSPKLDKIVLGYSQASYNTEIIPAGETFLFEKREDRPMLTRMYFTPYSYDQIHVVHHHGSVIWGNNDHSLHSCSTRSSEFLGWEETSWFNLIKKTAVSVGDAEMYSPAMIAASYHVIEEDKPLLFQFWAKKKYWDKRYLVTRSILETCNFTNQWEIAQMSFQSHLYNNDKLKKYLAYMLEGYAPLHKRFHLNTYLNENRLSFDQMPTMYNRVSLGKSKTEVFDVLKMLSEMNDDETIAEKKGE